MTNSGETHPPSHTSGRRYACIVGKKSARTKRYRRRRFREGQPLEQIGGGQNEGGMYRLASGDEMLVTRTRRRIVVFMPRTFSLPSDDAGVRICRTQKSRHPRFTARQLTGGRSPQHSTLKWPKHPNFTGHDSPAPIVAMSSVATHF